MKKAIITGPTGGVGISLIKELIEHDFLVTAVCRPGSNRIGAIPDDERVTVVQCSADELGSLGEKLPHDYSVFYHFLWDGTFGADRQDLYRQENNIRYTLDAVHLASDLGCEAFVGAGSQSEFGHIEGVMRPDLPCNPDNGYGIAKLAAGRMSRIECQKLGIRHEWCRILSLYGPYDGKNSMVMSTVIKMLNGERQQFTAGDQVWDYIYSKDVARAFRLVGEKGKDGAIYCLGTGKPRLLKEYIFAIRDAVDPSIEVVLGELDYYPNQVMHMEADITSLTEDTGFAPEYSFEQGIRETVEWVKQNL